MPLSFMPSRCRPGRTHSFALSRTGIAARSGCAPVRLVLFAAVAGTISAPASDRAAPAETDPEMTEVVRYADFGARGDGQTDDFEAISQAHAYANEHQLPVRADDTATYYIGGADLTVVIQTDTDFGTARFVIDDRSVENREANVFEVRSALPPIDLEGVASLRRNQPAIEATLPVPCLVIATDETVRRYIRFGRNQNDGSPQNDVFIVHPDGRVDPDTPIIWDFEQISGITAHPMDAERLTLSGGVFTTIANAAESRYTYYSRGIGIRRSNVLVEGLAHHITGEGDQGAPYGGFIRITNCANVEVRNTLLTGHKTYQTIGSAGRTVSMGSYDILVNRSVNVAFIDCRQTNDINDRTYWGIMGSNFCKNLRYERCVLSRFDAHQGVTNATIRHSTLGYMGINLIGNGTFLLENSTVYAENLINLRGDYGSTWQGDLVIRNCAFVPAGGQPVSGTLIGGHNSGQHDFGYPCYMPETVTIERLHIDDTRHPDTYQGPAIFSDFNPEFTDSGYREAFPYRKTRQVILQEVTTASGKSLRFSDNPAMFEDVVIRIVNTD